jgi:hypothetical protein
MESLQNWCEQAVGVEKGVEKVDEISRLNLAEAC